MTSTKSRPAVFTPEAVAAINRAYANAIDRIGSGAASAAARLELAEHMMSLARDGERDEGRLCALSVQAVLGRGTGSHHSVASAGARG